MNPATLSALAEPNRFQMVELLREGPLTVGELADRLQVRQPQVSKHLKVLQEVEIVEVIPSANRRYYKLRPEPFRQMDDWLDTFRSMWEEQLDRLGDYLKQLQEEQNK
ncbi:transcriptional regulator [Paenibacillus sp. J31TS4]|uniref:ArsR/SmtB family transcription factor n=1 Tax=Paenibacillus sp. J31TS4 TaxID=2807195 RepID=UPI001B18CA6A|nr:transcriptional regulator [Paenibacillus sp. J31TS4]